jgi:arginyl-tRNA synthetase
MEYKNKLVQLVVDSARTLQIHLEPHDVILERPADPKHGDIATPVALGLFKKLAVNGTNDFASPKQLAEELVTTMLKITAEPNSYFTNLQISVAGPGFINFLLDEAFLVAQMGEIIQNRASYPNQNENAQKRLLEHTSPNPNKAMHLGHLRNNVVGMAIGRLWQKVGYEVVFDAIDNNRGIAIAKLMWGYLKFARRDGDTTKTDIAYWLEHQDEWHDPESFGQRPDRFMDQLYVKAAQDCEKSSPDFEEANKQVKQMVLDWEAGDNANRQLWSVVLKYVYQGQQQTLQRLGNHWDLVWHEHEHYQQGKDFVALGLKEGVFKQLDDGAIITDLESQYGLTDTVVQKADGTALYITQDLALTQKKMAVANPDHAYWVIGPEQSLAMKQMFAVCEQLGIAKIEQLTHIPYGYMSLKGQGKMSSRKGTVVYIDELLDQAVERVQQVILDSEAKTTLDHSKVADTAEKIGVGAVKYSILRVGRTQDIAFDVTESVQLTGNAGPYLQYSLVRCYSLVSKLMNLINIDSKEWQNSDIAKPFDILLDNKSYSIYKWQETEIDLLRNLNRYFDTLKLAAAELAPQHLCTYLHELAQQFNVFYARQPILAEIQENTTSLEELPESVQARLLLVVAVALVIKDGLTVLGIESVERM